MRGSLYSGERASLDSDLTVPHVCCTILGKFLYLFLHFFVLKMGMVLLPKVVVKIRDDVCNEGT